MQTRRTKILAIFLGVGLLFFILPTQGSIKVPAIQHPADFQNIYPYAPSYIQDILVEENQRVRAGEQLAILISMPLEKEIRIKRADLTAFKKMRQSAKFQDDKPSEFISIDEQIAQAELELKNLEQQKKDLVVTAPFDGVISDIASNIHAGRYVGKTDLMFRIINPEKIRVSAYIPEYELDFAQNAQGGFFRAHYSFDEKIPLIYKGISQTNLSNLQWPELSSQYQGPIATDAVKGGEALKPRYSIYRADFDIKDPKSIQSFTVRKGFVRLQTGHHSPAILYGQKAAAFIQNELRLNN